MFWLCQEKGNKNVCDLIRFFYNFISPFSILPHIFQLDPIERLNNYMVQYYISDQWSTRKLNEFSEAPNFSTNNVKKLTMDLHESQSHCIVRRMAAIFNNSDCKYRLFAKLGYLCDLFGEQWPCPQAIYPKWLQQYNVRYSYPPTCYGFSQPLIKRVDKTFLFAQ